MNRAEQEEFWDLASAWLANVTGAMKEPGQSLGKTMVACRGAAAKLEAWVTRYAGERYEAGVADAKYHCDQMLKQVEKPANASKWLEELGREAYLVVQASVAKGENFLSDPARDGLEGAARRYHKACDVGEMPPRVPEERVAHEALRDIRLAHDVWEGEVDSLASDLCFFGAIDQALKRAKGVL